MKKNKNVYILSLAWTGNGEENNQPLDAFDAQQRRTLDAFDQQRRTLDAFEAQQRCPDNA